MADGIVLRSFDIGEADRFCIVLTREHGKIAVRVAGARKPASRLGSVLTLRRLRLEIHEHGTGGAVVRSASVLSVPEIIDARDFTVLQQAAELVVRLVDDRQHVPEVFDVCAAFFGLPPGARDIRAFTAALLHLLGVLPLTEEDARFAALSPACRESLENCVLRGAARMTPEISREADAFLTGVLQEHVGSPLVVPVVKAALA